MGPRVTVIGLGNVLAGDDAAGPWIVRTLEAEYALGPEVELLDGTPGNDLVPHLMGTRAVIVADSVSSAGDAGGIRLYRREALLATPCRTRLNPHQPGLKEALFTLDLMGEGPAEVLLVGVIPEIVRTGVGISAAVRRAIPLAVAEVVRELERLGCGVRRRATVGRADIWWEAPLLPAAGGVG